MSRKKTYREYKFQTGKVLPRRDKHGFYKDRNERFFLEKPTRKGRDIHPAAVVGEKRHSVLYVIVTHTIGGRYGEFDNPDPKAKKGKNGIPSKAGLNHTVQKDPDTNLRVSKRYSKFRHEPIDTGLDERVQKYKYGLSRKKAKGNKK